LQAKRKLLVLLLSFLFFENIFSQEIVNSITDRYYRSNPFHGKFSDFVKELIADPYIINKTVSKRTDSTLFFFKGEYTAHNPFMFKSTRTEIRLAEQEDAIFEGSPYNDTTVFYQLLAFADNSKNGANDVKAQLNSFFRDIRGNFNRYSSKKIKDNERTIGEIYNFTPKFAGRASVIASWMIINESESVFSITLRLKVRDNQAYTTQGFNSSNLRQYEYDVD